MRCLFAEDLGSYADKTRLLLELLDNHRDAVGHLFIESAEQLLADYLGSHLSLGLIGYHIVGEKPLLLGKELLALVEKRVHLFALFGANGHDGVELMLVIVGDDGVGHLLGVHRVHLIDGTD